MCLSCLRMWWISRRLFISELFLVLVGYHRMNGLKCSYCASREFLFVGLVLHRNSKGNIMIVMLEDFSITLYAISCPVLQTEVCMNSYIYSSFVIQT